MPGTADPNAVEVAAVAVGIVGPSDTGTGTTSPVYRVDFEISIYPFCVITPGPTSLSGIYREPLLAPSPPPWVYSHLKSPSIFHVLY